MILGISLVLVVGGSLGLLRAGAEVPQPVQWVAWPILALMLYGIWVGVRQLIRPPLMFTANNEGIVTYYLSEHNTHTGSGDLIPWASISSMALEKRRGMVSGVGAGNRSDVWVIACTLKENTEFDVEKHSSGRYASDAKPEICLDAWGELSGLMTCWIACAVFGTHRRTHKPKF
jgi:hypothetical protein